jgi:hypothetical protein
MGVRSQGPAFEASCPSSALEKLSAWAANSLGVRYPRLLCGRSSLYSFRHAAIFPAHRTGFETSSLPDTLPAAARENSPRVHSTSAFPAECPSTRSAAPHTMRESVDSLAPARCSQRIAKGCPRSATIPSNTRVILPGKARIHFQGQHSLVYASTTLSTWIAMKREWVPRGAVVNEIRGVVDLNRKSYIQLQL